MTIQYKHTELSVDISKLIYTELTNIYIVDMTSVIDSHISLSNILAYRTTILAVEFTDPSGQPSLDPAWIAPGLDQAGAASAAKAAMAGGVFAVATMGVSMDWFCWENLPETIDYPIKIMGLSCKFSLKPIH